MAAMAATVASVARLVSRQEASDTSQTLIFLALGALLGVSYSLGTEKFIRAMQHRHIFVRNAMLWLSASTWLLSAAAVAWVASQIYNQTNGGLEGFDRVLGVLIPFVVRADLIVDWAKRVAWALLNMATWTQSAVQMRRLIGRAAAMETVLSVDEEVRSMARTHQNRQSDLMAAEERVWTEDADSLVRLSEVLQHFEKLGRVAIYALGGLIGAVPGCIVWILYAAYHGFKSFRKSLHLVGSLYWISILLAPLGAVILILASTGLLCGVVTLSIVGTVIQFSVYWSTRIVFSMVRITLSQQWAGFPDITKPHSSAVEQDPPGPNAGSYAVRPVRHPEEAGAAISQMGSLLPTELEFALASWDGHHHADNVDAVTSVIPQKILSLTGIDLMSTGNLTDVSNLADVSRHLSGTRLSKSTTTISPGSSANRASGSEADDDRSGDGSPADGKSAVEGETGVGKPSDERDVALDNETTLILLGRLGLDLSVKTPRKRRLSIYYSLGMLVHLQIDSGGNAWRLHSVPTLSDLEFDDRMAKFNCFIADEAKVALQELTMRLRGSSKYRVIPTGAPNSAMVPVTTWLRSVLLAFLETPAESDGGKILRMAASV